MITHEEAKECISRLFNSYVYGDFIPFPTRSDLDTLSLYINQKEKVTELSELYKEKNLLIEVLYVGIGNDQINKYQMKGKSENYKRLEEILIRIETLEKELGEMK